MYSLITRIRLTSKTSHKDLQRPPIPQVSSVQTRTAVPCCDTCTTFMAYVVARSPMARVGLVVRALRKPVAVVFCVLLLTYFTLLRRYLRQSARLAHVTPVRVKGLESKSTLGKETLPPASPDKVSCDQRRVSCRWCVLSPAWRPAFADLDRLVQSTIELAEDLPAACLFAILTDEDEVREFRENFPQSARHLNILTFESALKDRRWTDGRLNDTFKLDFEINTESRGWEPRRVTQALKKLLGLEFLYQHYSCKLGWVLDSESVPLRRFSFAEHFRDFESNPRLIVTNMSDPYVELSERHATLTRQSLEGLGLTAYAHGDILSFRTVDYWIFALADISRMMSHVSNVHNKSFTHVFIRHPAEVAVYYGNFILHGPASSTKTIFFIYPTSLRRAGFEPVEGAVLSAEAALDIFRCNDAGPWTAEQLVKILNGPLAWVRGWRFDHLPAGGCLGRTNWGPLWYYRRARNSMGIDNVQVLVENATSITWATSNFDGQVRIIGVASQ